ncbi:S41 family peptidase [Bacillus sp. FJAT-49736]|uniref:S41 family peptidase n=1 Tax=Bacillus sp. FJAT-49736 TaxID=2833582 RepID=UPI001BC9C45A|nr:S41 family peptidase [Bacillus sp. FJAT-49736]MBS4174111.1 peptidoglycan-binding protein [Bacillus sp. FJAT-49736]
MKRKWLAVLISGSLVTGAGGTYAGMKWYYHDTLQKAESNVRFISNQNQHILPDLSKIAQAYDLIMKSYVKKVDEKELVEGAIQGMVSTLKDPFSVYMDAKTATQFNNSLDSSFEGIGAEVAQKDGKIVIVAPYKDSPAEKAGLRPKDVIVKIDGVNTHGLDLTEATMRIRGKKGTTVTLEIQREGTSDPLTFKVKRESIPLETVFSDVKMEGDQAIGYLEITQFSKDTALDFNEKLKKLETNNINGLIIDVRGNPGGYLSSVEEMLKGLVTNEKPYFQIEQRNGEKLPYYSKLKEKKPYPIAVLVDEGSASAAEILASSLKEADGYMLIGERTFGKGTVQQAMSLGDGSSIKLTMYKWLTPDGNWIHQKGIEPNIEVKQPEYFYVNPLTVDHSLKLDANNEQVKLAQQILSGLGYGPGREDGYFDSQTERAVKAFQNQERLPATGEIDQKTAETLDTAVSKAKKEEKNDLQLQVALKYISSKN